MTVEPLEVACDEELAPVPAGVFDDPHATRLPPTMQPNIDAPRIQFVFMKSPNGAAARRWTRAEGQATRTPRRQGAPDSAMQDRPPALRAIIAKIVGTDASVRSRLSLMLGKPSKLLRKAPA